MLQRKSAEGCSDETRRLVLQLAVQLPESTQEARAVVDELAGLLETYMVRSPRSLWERQVLAAEPELAAPPAVFWTVAIMFALVPLAAGVYHLAQMQGAAMLTMQMGVVSVTLIFGRSYGLGAAVIAMIAHNLFIVAPVLEFSVPTRLEVLFAACHLTSALIVPGIADRARALRAAAMLSCGRPAARRPSPGSFAPG